MEKNDSKIKKVNSKRKNKKKTSGIKCTLCQGHL